VTGSDEPSGLSRITGRIPTLESEASVPWLLYPLVSIVTARLSRIIGSLVSSPAETLPCHDCPFSSSGPASVALEFMHRWRRLLWESRSLWVCLSGLGFGVDWSMSISVRYPSYPRCKAITSSSSFSLVFV
jgi:hypothetical protein